MEPTKTRLLLGHAYFEFRRAVPVADRDVALLPKWVVIETVFGEVAMNRTVIPIDDRMDFGDLVLVMNHGQLASGAGLRAAQSGQPRSCP